MFDKEAFLAYLDSDHSIPFNIFAQNPSDWAWVQEVVPSLIISSAGGMFPFQAEGLVFGRPFYYRSETNFNSDGTGYAELRLGHPDGEAPYWGPAVLYDAEIQSVERREQEDFIPNLFKLIPLLSRSKFFYEFEGYKVVMTNDGKWGYTIDTTQKDTRGGWGYTAEEAFDEMLQPASYLVDRGISEDTQLQMLLDQQFSRVPIKLDTRDFPLVDPDFSIKIGY